MGLPIYNSELFIEIGNFSEYLHENTERRSYCLILYDINKNKELAITGLHLKSGYEDMEDRRSKEVFKALKLVNEWLSSNSRDHISQIIAGDFNSEHKRSPSYKYYSKVNDIIKNQYNRKYF